MSQRQKAISIDLQIGDVSSESKSASIKIYECRNGSHWKETHQYRDLENMSPGAAALFVFAHILLLPFVLFGFLFTLLYLPLYPLWALARRLRGRRSEFRPEVLRLQQIAKVNDVFVYGARDEARPAVSIVMPFYNRAEWVEWAVGSILSQAVPMCMEVEIIAVDNGSTDGTVEKLKQHPVRLVECAERGPGAARNAGIAAARAPIIAFTDSDCLADPDWLMQMVRPFWSDPEMLITGGRLTGMMEDYYVGTFTSHEHLLSNERFFKSSAYFPRFFATASMACRKDALDQIGKFDNSLWMSEDADLSWRLLNLGGRMGYIDDAIIYHHHRITLMGLYRQAADYGAASVSIFKKHRSSLGAGWAISWQNLRTIAWSPLEFIIAQFTAKVGYHRTKPLLHALWRLGFTIGSIRECIKQRVLFF